MIGLIIPHFHILRLVIPFTSKKGEEEIFDWLVFGMLTARFMQLKCQLGSAVLGHLKDLKSQHFLVRSTSTNGGALRR